QGAAPLPVTGFSYASLTGALGGDPNTINWSADGTRSTSGELYISRARTDPDPNVQSTPWGARTPSQTGTTFSQVQTVGNTFASSGTALSGGGATLSSANPSGYTAKMPQWAGTWPAPGPERTGFGRLDLYQDTANAAGVFQGYFEFLNDG